MCLYPTMILPPTHWLEFLGRTQALGSQPPDQGGITVGSRWTRSVAGSAVVGSTRVADPAPQSGRLCGNTDRGQSQPARLGFSASNCRSSQLGLEPLLSCFPPSAPRPGRLWPEHPEATAPGPEPPAAADPSRTTFPRMPRGPGVHFTAAPRAAGLHVPACHGARARPHLAPARGCTRPAPEVATGSRAGGVEWVQVRPLERRGGGGDVASRVWALGAP